MLVSPLSLLICGTLAALRQIFHLSTCPNLPRHFSQRRAVTGTGIGAAGGAVIGAMAGNAGLGAVIGAGAGLAGGLLVDKTRKNEQAAYQSGYAAGQSNR